MNKNKSNHNNNNLRKRININTIKVDVDVEDDYDYYYDDDKKRKGTDGAGGVHSRYTCTDYTIYILAGLVGFSLLVYISAKYASLLKLAHENHYWFSKISAVEREISFRTEAGLYYSYFKRLTLTSNIEHGLQELVVDNRTEAWRTINVIQRFNIFQEIFLASVYRFLQLNESTYERIYFYVDFIFNLHGVYMGALGLITWLVTRSFVGSILCAAFFVFNLNEATRVHYTMPLRESFAIPFIYVQVALICVYLKTTDSKSSMRTKRGSVRGLLKAGIFISTLLFCLFWQFSQFVLLLQSFAIFAIYLLSIVDSATTKWLFVSNIISLLFTFGLQFANNMIISAFALHFCLVAYVFVRIEEKFRIRSRFIFGNFLLDFLYSIFTGILVLAFAIGSAIGTKLLLNIDADDHILKFVMNKLSIDRKLDDFDTRLYLCNGGFGFMSIEEVGNLTNNTFLLPIYILAQLYYLFYGLIKWLELNRLGVGSIDNKLSYHHHSPQLLLLRKRPELIFFTVQTLFFCILSISTMRMKYLWIPSACILASILISDYAIFERLLQLKRVNYYRHLLTAVFVYLLYYQNWNRVMNEINHLGEFYDPDTVELMNWINESTHVDATFTGSMQLLASVKLCTNRKLTNHPHYEDRELRDVTKQLYQIYALRAPDEVYKILREYKTDYIVLEDSICLSHPKPGYCSLKEIIDISNKHLLVPPSTEEQQIKTREKRFCDEIRHNRSEYATFFKLVFSNKTFRIYKLK